MPIYSNVASTLARQGPRTLAYGYAQSFIAVTHPQVYASQNRPGLSRYRTNKISLLSSYQFQNVFHNGSQNTSSNTHVRNEKCDGGLDAYFEAWRKTHAAGEPEKEWTQFQFAKRIEWKPGSVSVEKEIENTIQTENSGKERQIEQSGIKINESISQNGNQMDEVAALADIDTADNEIEIKTGDPTSQTQENLITTQSAYQTPQTQEKYTNLNANKKLSYPSSPNSARDLQSRKYENHLIKLSKDQKHVEIPAVFEAMLVAGVNPTVTAYNTLIDSALQISPEKSNSTSKVLEIYSDMRRRNVLPDSTTYQKILTILASRILEVNQLKKQLEEKRVRFGGIDFEGKFMLNSSEIKYATLVKDDNVDILTEIYDDLIESNADHNYSSELYHQLITAYSTSGRKNQMTKIFEHMKAGNVIPMASTFCQMINCVAKCGELDKAVDYYNIYKNLAIDHDNGTIKILDRQDSLVYASLIKAYVVSDRMSGALKFYNKIIEVHAGSPAPFSEAIVHEGFVKGLIESGMLSEALKWAENITGALRYSAMTNITTVAADLGMRSIADTAFEHLLQNPQAEILTPTMSMLALSVREGRVQAAEYYWEIMSHPLNNVNFSFIEPTAMFAVAMIGSGKIFEGLISSENMFDRIRKSAVDKTGHLYDEVNEGIMFINNFMSERGIFDPRLHIPESISTQTFALPPPTISMYEDSFDPYASKTDYKGSSIISDELDRASSRGRGGKLSDIVSRFKNIRSMGRHPRYAVYAKLISAAAREKKMDLVHEIHEMARVDVPLLQQYYCVRHGWISILDAMIGACLTLGDRNLAAQYHQELLSIGAVPTANTFGLYITTLKGCTKTFDEAADAIKIFNQAKSEGVKPSSFLYNALIGKLGKARRIDDCLHYFSEMRYLGIRPTSVTYGTIVNALCRVSDEKLAEFLFEEMESMPNYKPRPAPYNSLMQFFLNTKRDKSKVLSYFERMMKKGIKPTSHTYKLIVDAHATLDPINMAAAEAVLDIIRRTGQEPEAVHYSSLIHAKGCVMHDIDGAKAIFESVMADPSISPQACLYQALFEAMVSNHLVHETESILKEMPLKGVEMTPYIANTLIHGWTSQKNIHKAESIYSLVKPDEREPSTYDAMIRAYLIVENRLGANSVVKEMLSRNYPSAVSSKICDLLGVNHAENCD